MTEPERSALSSLMAALPWKQIAATVLGGLIIQAVLLFGAGAVFVFNVQDDIADAAIEIANHNTVLDRHEAAIGDHSIRLKASEAAISDSRVHTQAVLTDIQARLGRIETYLQNRAAAEPTVLPY